MGTLREYYEATRVRTFGAPDSTDPLWERRLSLVIDGRPLGDYATGTPLNKESAKRLDEMQALAYALVGCNADLKLEEAHFLMPVAGRATADFEATTSKGSNIFIELARLVDPNEKRYLDTIDRITGGANELLNKSQGAAGRFFLRFYHPTPPMPADVRNASKELAAFVESDIAQREPSTTLWPADACYPTLHRLGAHVARESKDNSAWIMVEPSRMLGDSDATAATFPRIVEQKKRKVPDYSKGEPVWLTLYVDTRLFYPLSIIEGLRTESTFDPRPFDRVLVGCFTAGVSFLEPNKAPQYTSLTANG